MKQGYIFRQLVRQRDGAAAVEFALIAPMLIMVLMGMFDLGFNVYINATLQGAVQQAARKSTVESALGSNALIDRAVEKQIKRLVPSAEVKPARKAYSNFSSVGLPEDFTDVNANGTCNAGEPFEDANGNGIWDHDRGANGMGGARDAVLYTVTVEYKRLFPMATLIGLPPKVTTVAKTVLRNQPYDSQKSLAKPGTCI
ncbi:MAG: pilus assembly protein [Novosphingobium sp.]|nr:pilus assembly protein [Novosphingobium sp.]